MPVISRRDFLSGTALAIASGLTPAAQIAARPSLYPPAMMGLRGQHEGSFETAHALVQDRNAFAIAQSPVAESYDLVVVGGGISGLAAAWFYRRRNPRARILILDNHDDFGGHAKRNEFTAGGRTIVGYGGSESIQSPRALYSKTAAGLLDDLGVRLRRFDAAFDQELYPSLKLSRGVFFPREGFGRDVLVHGDPQAQRRANARPLGDFIAATPLTPEGKAQLAALYESAHDPLAGKSVEEKTELLKRTSYREFLTRDWKVNAEVADFFQGRPLGWFGLGCDAVPAADLRDFRYPGFGGLGLPEKPAPAREEPYIYHFPDGNAALARLLVRALIPGAAPGGTMDDIVTARFDYGRLDRPANRVRIRLNATCVNVEDDGRRALVAYVQAGNVRRVAANHVVLACFHMMIPYIVPSLPEPQRLALSGNVKTPLVYTNVLVRDWRAFVALKVHNILAPLSFHSTVKLDFPVSLGGYRHPRHPGEPILLHLVHVAGEPNKGLDARAQFRIGRHRMLQMTFADFEDRIRDELDRMLSPGGFSSARDIMAITVNRWPHGYSYVANSLFDPDDYDATTLVQARASFGRIAIANTDAGGDAWTHYAIDEAARAVDELASRP